MSIFGWPSKKQPNSLTILAGTEHSRYALPIEYPPSRDFQARWGNTRPPIPQLAAWFAEHEQSYRAFLRRMRDRALELKDVPKKLSNLLLPLPAWSGVPYCAFDALALYTMIAEKRPKRYLEIGSGITTCWAHLAKKNAGLTMQIISIDPEPRAHIDGICNRIIRDGLETCDPSIVDELEAGDILFFDGSHRSFMNSDVTVFFIDFLPRLKPGVLVHIHDINLPYDYPEWAKPWYWNEQYMLAVYMMGNKARIDPVLPTAFVCRTFADDLTPPPLDLGIHNDGWLGGGAMWFAHHSSP